MTASIHKLTAGSGYDYLTRQVAAMDATEKGHTGLASYYTEQGETPGVWMGSGLEALEGLEAGDIVTADHMQSLFGAGHHPLAKQRAKELDLRIGRPGEKTPTEADYQAATRLGTPFKVYDNDVTPFQREVAKRFAAFNAAAGLPGDWPIPVQERARIRTEVGREFFKAEHGRDPVDARELAASIAKNSRPKTTAVAGYDITFSPVKSFSVLWALADRATAAKLEQAHLKAVADTLKWIEDNALFTREGTNGVRQVDVRGMLATAFTHRDTRSGDPDLHTHVAIANKVQTLEGKWLAIDGRTLFKMMVAISEHYNTRLEAHSRKDVGLAFTERPNEDARKQPVREVVGVDAGVAKRFSKRRATIESRRNALTAEFQRTHGRPPTPVETLSLAQQATLETREKKHEPRSLAQQRADWMREASDQLGGTGAVHAMIQAALHLTSRRPSAADSQWFRKTTGKIVAKMEGSRAAWQPNHVIAEAWRHIRAAEIPADQQHQVLNMLVDEVLTGHSISLARPADGITEPEALRRRDGTSVYTQAHADLFTSTRVVEAEHRLVAAAGRTGGRTVDESTIDMALLESTANGVTLNPGQTTLVREMATSGSRLQLAIAPAGSGKTTAMKVLARAWAAEGGVVIGLGPSAAAADELGAQFRAASDTQQATADTLAMLTFALDKGSGLPEWAHDIDERTLVVIDEAGMADTVSLDTAVQFILDRGASVRLIGDDQQLAAIGAGGVLRDIRATHGALQLSELMRFSDTAEAGASLALREGRTEALGFYLDKQRVHIGDLGTMTEEVFNSWTSDRGRELDAIMLAPTRELVAELNQRARAHRLEGVDPAQIGRTVRLGDGNDASVGDVIITRRNKRSLRLSATDWVKNGDRWTVVDVDATGGLRAQHTKSGRLITLPAWYVKDFADLGYACTVHTAQGVTADVMHGLATDELTRQLLYTMMTRGRLANHVYMAIVGDGDPHSVIRPEMLHPRTATDALEKILGRDAAPKSATTLLRDAADPATLLGEATATYVDALYFSAEKMLDTDVVSGLDKAVDTIVPGLSEEAAWPALRAQLLLRGAAGEDPVALLRAAAGERELDTAGDMAAVLDWRLDSTGARNSGQGPLPWLPAIPAMIQDDPVAGSYLQQRADLVAELAQQVRERAENGTLTPSWAGAGARLDARVIGDVEVWRAAMGVDPGDRRPTGTAQQQKAAGTWQRQLNRKIAGDRTPAIREWKNVLATISPAVLDDDYAPTLAERVASMARAGLNARRLLEEAAKAGPLPDEHAAAALWWRIARHISPAVAARTSETDHVTVAEWAEQLGDLIGTDRLTALQNSSSWPALVSIVDQGLHRGWQLHQLLGIDPDNPTATAGDVDEAQVFIWRASIALDDIPSDEDEHLWEDEENLPPEDLDATAPDAAQVDDASPVSAPEEDWTPLDPLEEPYDPAWEEAIAAGATAPDAPPADAAPAAALPAETPEAQQIASELEEELVREADRILTLSKMSRDLRSIPEEAFTTEADLRRMIGYEQDWATAPVSRERMLEVNDLAQQFFAQNFAADGAWARPYLAGRFGRDLAGHEHIRPGQAPAGWSNLVTYLRRHGVSDDEMVATGLAKPSSKGNLIDRFRDRVTFPVVTTGPTGAEILGFVARLNPEIPVDEYNPKYLNTPNTPLFHKGAQLFTAGEHLLTSGATPVIVEGPMDAIAVTLATRGTHVGVAPLGTSLTDDQVAQLARQFQHTGVDPIVATDGDVPGRVAAERDFWLLAGMGLVPSYAQLQPGEDPSSLLTAHGPEAVSEHLAQTRPLGEILLAERLDNLSGDQALHAALKVLAAQPGGAWAAGIDQIVDRLEVSEMLVRRGLAAEVLKWDADPRKGGNDGRQDTGEVKKRLERAERATSPAERWASLAAELDPRLLEETDWPATAQMLQDAHDQGHDVAAATRALVAEEPLDDQPARDLRYRVVSRLDVAIDTGEGHAPIGTTGGAEQTRKQISSTPTPGRGTPRR